MRWSIIASGVALSAWIVPGITYDDGVTLVVVVALLSLFNAILKPLLVLFDSCWDPLPVLGPQHPPIPGVHNSGWVQSPGAKELADPAYEPKLRAYVVGIVGAFAKDDRILGWDV